MNARAAKRLYDGKQAAVRLTEFLAGKTLEGFLAGEMWRFAVERQAGILASAISASVREAPELEDRLPGWEMIVGLQEYLSLDATADDLERLWVVVTRDVQPLLVAIEAELEHFGMPGDGEECGQVHLQLNELIVRNLEGIVQICNQSGVEKLEVFGSATTGAFTESSDIDFLVTFTPETQKPIARYMEMESALGSLLGREIDLIDDKEFENPYFRHSVRMTRMSVFDMNLHERGFE